MGRTGGGSGRSSGGGGGRSCGGRSGGSGGGRSGRSGYTSPKTSYGSSHRNSYGIGHYGGHHHNYRKPRYYGHRKGSVLGAVVILIVFFIIYAIIVGSSQSKSESDVTKSTIAREPLIKGSVIETDYYTDEIGDWISNGTKLTTGMRNFYQRTGVQPYLFIADNLDGNINPNAATAEEWLNTKYDELFSDEAHTMLLFYERDGNYSMWYLNGRQAKTVMDTEAMDILMDYIELYYYSDLTEDEMFSKAYDNASIRIMEITREPIPWYAYFLILLTVIVIIVVLFKFWKTKKEQKNIEDENTRKILETPLQEIDNSFLKE